MAEALTTVLPRSFASVGTFRRASRPTRGAVRTLTRATLDDERDASSRASFSIGRRASLAGAGASALAGTFPLPSRADVLTPKGYDDPVVSPTGWNLLESDKDTIGCAYVIEWPSGWCALSDLSSARTVGVDASWKNPLDEASTLAVFISDAAGARSVADRGSLEKVAASRADSAPRQFCVGKRKRQTPVGDGGPRGAHLRRRDQGGRRHGRAIRKRGGAGGHHRARGKRVSHPSHRERLRVAGGEGETETRRRELPRRRQVSVVARQYDTLADSMRRD